MDLTTAAWIAIAYVATVWVLTLRATVRLAAPRVDNGWDNAIGYALFSGALLWPCSWLVEQGPWGWMSLPLVVGCAQIWMTRVIYQVRNRHAALLVALHGMLAGAVYAVSLVSVGALIVYLAYGRIVSDPLLLLRLLARLIGIEL